MKVKMTGRNTDKFAVRIQMNKAQVTLLRNKLKCHNKPVQYAGGKMYAQSKGWYAIFASEDTFSGLSSQSIILNLVRKIRNIFNSINENIGSCVSRCYNRKVLKVKKMQVHGHKVLKVVNRALSLSADLATNEIRYFMELVARKPSQSQLDLLVGKFAH